MIIDQDNSEAAVKINSIFIYYKQMFAINVNRDRIDDVFQKEKFQR